LRLYERLASELGHASFFAQPEKLSVKVSPEESYERLEHAGTDALRSMTMTSDSSGKTASQRGTTPFETCFEITRSRRHAGLKRSCSST
jgi:hypothetical protein